MMSDYEIILSGMADLSITTQWPSIQSFSRPTALTKFHLFRKLPAELRIKIWRLAASVPRIIRYKPVGGSAPGILQASYESREQTCRYYRMYNAHSISRRQADFFIQRGVDILYIDEDITVRRGRLIMSGLYMPEPMRLAVKRMICNLVDGMWKYGSVLEIWFLKIACAFANVEEITFVAGSFQGEDINRLVPITENSFFGINEFQEIGAICNAFERAQMISRNVHYDRALWWWKSNPTLRFMRYIPTRNQMPINPCARGTKRMNPFQDDSPWRKIQRVEEGRIEFLQN
ncbi:hypothetical protein B7494_g7799 [Chlorociboria aeruginascens]|nr:hypothetical protein B7494_g7799 [Chlorociboria aeruginascens]